MSDLIWGTPEYDKADASRLRAAADALWDHYRDKYDAMPEPLRSAWRELTSAICEGPRSDDR